MGKINDEHFLRSVYYPEGVKCDICDRYDRNGSFCEIYKFTLHKRCVFLLAMPQEIHDHPSHDGHAMGLELLKTGAPPFSDPECHICGNNTRRILYHCNTCNLNMHIDCMIGALCSSPRPSPLQLIMDALDARTYVQMPWHPHPLFRMYFDYFMYCEVSGSMSGFAYVCLACRLIVDDYRVFKFKSSLEITHPIHAKHSLKLLTTGTPSYTDPGCHICGDGIENILYHCDICKFNLDTKCALKSPPEAALSDLKVHEHTLTLIPRLISFICDACGMKGDHAPYVCLQCNFVVHQDCARLPRVIHVNRHDHRVSYKYPIGRGEWKCGICLEEVNWSCGAYSCALCRPNIVLHSRCATSKDVWDGEELDGVPEEVEDVEPFKMNDDNTITHFAHEHNMSLNKDGIALEESILCGACVRPISFNTFYYCSDCSFILHETCANLLKKKRLFLSTKPLTLDPISQDMCHACYQHTSEGFIYASEGSNVFDLICSSITIPFIHGSHPHPLVFIKRQHVYQVTTCNGCKMDTTNDVLGCTKCNYYLDFRCATLPTTVRLERCDDHSLTLCYGEKANGKYWCDICERETNPEGWFYTCRDCGVTLHILCVLGDIRYAKPGGKICIPDGEIEGMVHDIELLPNIRSSRPLCDYCHCRCPGPFILKFALDSFMCSYYCCDKSVWPDVLVSFAERRCPPWIKTLEPETSCLY